MQHEGLFIGALQGIDILLVLAGAQRGNHDRLGLAAGEQGAAMGAGQDAHLRDDLSHGGEVTPIYAPGGAEDIGADDVLLHMLEGARNPRRDRAVVVGGNQRLDHLMLDGGHAVPALMLGGDGIGLAQVLLRDLADLGRQIIDAGIGGEVPGLLGGALGELDDGVEHWLEMLVPEHDGAEHDVLGQLLGLRFDHQHGAAGAGHHEVERAFAHLVDRRVQHVLAADIANPRRRDRPEERNAGQGQRG